MPTFVEYLQSDGYQYIDTGINLATNIGFKVTFLTNNELGTTNYGCILGGRYYGGINEDDFQLTTFNFSDQSTWGGTIRDGYNNAYPAHITRNEKITISLKNNVITYNDGTTTAVTPYTFTRNVSVYLFGLRDDYNGGFTQSGSGCRIYDVELYIGDNVVWHGKPALDENNVPCMYDTVSETYFYNKGTGTFTYGTPLNLEAGNAKLMRKLALLLADTETPVISLPYQYQVEYLESSTDSGSGTSNKPYIDTEIYLWGYEKNKSNVTNKVYDVRFDVTFQVAQYPTIYGYGNVLGTRQSGNTNEFQVTLYSNGSVSKIKRNTSLGFNNSSKHHIYFTAANKVMVDNAQKTLTYYNNTLTEAIGSFVLFAIRQGTRSSSSVTQHEKVRIYHCQIEIDGVVLGNFIPVVDWQDVPCMYDTVRERLFYNAGNGSFIAGNRI